MLALLVQHVQQKPRIEVLKAKLGQALEDARDTQVVMRRS
jgi:hypothetical protein